MEWKFGKRFLRENFRDVFNMMSGVTEFVNQNTFSPFKIGFVSFSFGCVNTLTLSLK